MSKNKIFLGLVLFYILSIVVAVGIGRYMSPSKIEYKEKVITDEKSLLLAKEQIQELTSQIETLKKNVKTHTVTVVVKEPNGRETTTKTEDTDTNVETTKQVDSSKFLTKEINHYIEKKIFEERSKIVEAAKPNWHLSLLAGVNISSLASGEITTPLPQSLLGQPWVLGLHGERRVLGPVWMGVWGTTDKSAGISLGVEW